MKYLSPVMIQEIETFFSAYPIRKFKKGQILVLPGETAEYAYFLVRGRIKAYDKSYKGDQIIIDMFSNPSFFPLSLIMNQSPSFLFHEADTDIEVHQAPVKEALEFLNTHPDVVLSLLSVVYRKFDDASKRMIRLMDSGAKVRLIYEIIVACRQLGEQQPNGSWRLGISQTVLGARIGLSRETVSREIKSLKQKGYIETGRSSIMVPDIKVLETYLESHT